MSLVNFVDCGWVKFRKNDKIYEYYGRELSRNNEVRVFIYGVEGLVVPIKDIIDEERDIYAPEFNNVYKLKVIKDLKDEQGNRNCKFCTGKSGHYLSSGLEIDLINNNLDSTYSGCACGSFEDKLKINYCPMCGKKLG